MPVIDEVLTFHQTTDAMRDDLPFEIDGVVVKLDRRDWQDQLGSKSRSPDGPLPKFACRLKENRGHSGISRSQWRARTGTLTPLALLKPVEVGESPSARDAAQCRRSGAQRDVRVGDTVKREWSRRRDSGNRRTGARPGRRQAPFVMPDHCPVCGSGGGARRRLLYCTGQTVSYGATQRCDRTLRLEERAEYRRAGEETVAQLVDAGMVKDLADLYSPDKEQLLTLEGFADRSASLLMDSIERSKAVSTGAFIWD